MNANFRQRRSRPSARDARDGRGAPPRRHARIGLTIQGLQPNQRVLILGSVAGTRAGHGWFTTDEVLALFDALRLPPPDSVLRSFGQLRTGHVVRTRGDGLWALTPQGEEEVLRLMGEIDPVALGAEMGGTPGAEFVSALHTTISPALAPARWQAGIARMLERFPFETNVFCMTRFARPGSPLPDPVLTVIGRLREVAELHSLTLHVASDRQNEDDLFGNVGAYMWACQYGIGLLENRAGGGTGLNDNVLIELGSMMVIGRRCAMLKDTTAPGLPSDLTAQLYKSVDFDDLEAVGAAAHRWIAEDLGLGQCGSCPI